MVKLARSLPLCLLILLLSACAAGGGVEPSDENPSLPVAVRLAQETLAGELAVPVDQITIIQFSEATWPDACLGLDAPGETCSESDTAGFEVQLGYIDQTYQYRTDSTGSQIRQVPFIIEPGEAALQARQLLAGLLGYDPASIHILSEQNVAFNDTCLEIIIPETACAQVRTRGLRITLEAEDQFFEFRTAESPINPVLAEAAGLLASEPVISWTRNGGAQGYCEDLRLFLNGKAVQYTCKGIASQTPGIIILSAEQVRQLLHWAIHLQPFEDIRTDLDGVTFRLIFSGTGFTQASPEDEDAILDFTSQMLAPQGLPTPASK